MAIIQWKGTEPGAPPASDYWQPDERRQIEDPEQIASLLTNPNFVLLGSSGVSATTPAPLGAPSSTPLATPFQAAESPAVQPEGNS